MPNQSAFDRTTAIQKSIENHPDPQIQTLAAQDVPGSQIIAALLHEIVPEDIAFELVFVAPGKSGAKVILVRRGTELPLLVKFGETKMVRSEEANFHRFVKSKVPLANRVDIFNGLVEVGEFAAIAYSWAGGYSDVPTLREFFTEDAFVDVLKGLLVELGRWQEPRRDNQLLFDQWDFSDEQVPDKQIPEIIRKVKASSLGSFEKQRLVDALRKPALWRDRLKLQHWSKGLCHGDLNARNVLVAASGTGHVPIVIDYASIVERGCPAQDWARLEREIKFRCVWEAPQVGGLPPDVGRFAENVQAIDALTVPQGSNDPLLGRAIEAIGFIRSEYIQKHRSSADRPDLEYDFFLLFWTLKYVINSDDQLKVPGVLDTILRSALTTLDRIENNLTGSVREVVVSPNPF